MNTPSGGEACPYALLPQQTTDPSDRNPHEWSPPVDTAVNTPSGGEACPYALLPQQTTDPCGRNPHEWFPPVDTAVNTPSGGDACPRLLRPQQTTDPSDRNPHTCDLPADTAVKVFDVGGFGCPVVAVGQVTTLDLALRLITTQTCSPGKLYQHAPFVHSDDDGQCHVSACQGLWLSRLDQHATS